MPLLKGNYVHKDAIPNLDPKYSVSNRFNTWTPMTPGMTESTQWLYSPWRSLEVFFVRLLHYSKYKGQTRTLSLNCNFCHFLAKQGFGDPIKGLLEDPGGSKNRLQMSSEPENVLFSFPPRSFFPFSKFWGNHWGPETLRVLGGMQNRLHPITFLTSTMNLKGTFLQFCVFGPKCPNSGKSG